MEKPEDLKIFIVSKASSCGECGENLGRGAWISLNRDKGALCLACSDLDHLVFLPSGNTALTRRSKKYSRLWAVVLKWSKARKRYERQGLLVEESALEQAEEDCAADEDERARRRLLAQERHAELDKAYVKSFAVAICEQFPGCPIRTANTVARHTCRKYSGRVGRSAAAKVLDPAAVTLAMIAYIRHTHTQYDELLMTGWNRHDARRKIQHEVEARLKQWRHR